MDTRIKNIYKLILKQKVKVYRCLTYSFNNKTTTTEIWFMLDDKWSQVITLRSAKNDRP